MSMRWPLGGVSWALVWALGCGGAAPPAEGTSIGEPGPAAPKTGPKAPQEPSEEAAGPTPVPSECKKGGSVCLPPEAFVKKLCAGYFPDVALSMFRKGTPWTRGYLAADVEAWNASGGTSSADTMKFDEEVLMLRKREAATGGMQVSGAGSSYDVLRWDGTCATLAEQEVTTKMPPKARHARVTWKDLGESVQSALLDDPALKDANHARKQECKGLSMGDVSQKCVKLVEKQSELIVEFVRNGGEVPTPPPLP